MQCTQFWECAFGGIGRILADVICEHSLTKRKKFKFDVKLKILLFLYMKVHELAKLLKHGSFPFTILTHTFHLHTVLQLSKV